MPFLNPQSYLFLTTKPLVRRLHVHQYEWLYIEPIVDIAFPTMYIRVHYTDATFSDVLYDLVELRKHEVKIIDMSFATQEYDQLTPGKPISKIEVWIEIADQEGDKITYIPWSPNTDNFKQFFYLNGQGGMDSFICIGDGQSGFEYTGEIAVRQVDDTYRTEHGQEHSVNRRVRQLFTAHSGYKPRKEILAVGDMLTADEIYIVETFNDVPRFVRVLANAQGFTAPADLANLNHFDFQYKYSWLDLALDRVK